jgi:hypothetical protein
MVNTTARGDSKEQQLKRTATQSVMSDVEQTAEHETQQDPITLFIDPRLLTGAVDIDDLEENENESSAAVETRTSTKSYRHHLTRVLPSSESMALILFVASPKSTCPPTKS